MSYLSFDSLRSYDDFAPVLASSLKHVGRYFVLFARPFTLGVEFSAFRLGIIASRRVGGAVERNRIKRLIREAMRSGLPASLEQNDVVVIVRRGAGKTPNRRLFSELSQLLQAFQNGLE